MNSKLELIVSQFWRNARQKQIKKSFFHISSNKEEEAVNATEEYPMNF